MDQGRDPAIRKTILRRRLTAIAMAVGATALIWLLFVRGGGSEAEPTVALTPARVSDETRGLLATLSPEEKVRELVLAAVEPGETATATGGVLLTADAWPGEAAGAAYTDSIRKAANGAVPPLIATRQEGGVYRELADLPPNEREIELGDAGDPRRATAWGEQTASALRKHGIDLNLGPVADIATLDSPIADRAFSDDPDVTEAMTAAAVRGCRRGGVACAPSHFPGVGGASQDTDSGPATVSLDRATLLNRDVGPFAAAIRQGAQAVVVSHAFYAAYDPVTPASLSPEILDGILRGELGFEGVAITDDLEAGAIRIGGRVSEAAVSAIVAGADVVQLSDPGSAEPVLRALEDAVASGTIPPERLDAAAARVLELKRRAGLLDT